MIKEKEIIIKLLSALFPKAKIYLFGSRARGTYKLTSDIDIALDIGEPISGLDLVKARNIIDALNIPQKVDLVDFNSVPQALKDNILKEGVVWKI
ncbi:nucleotidyltransferase domain-containing protein [Candidatus Dependentiae bacterium]|nr:nucleotidyltransferase domain-containing protein [Candidatus Dependentiae bacterium]